MKIVVEHPLRHMYYWGSQAKEILRESPEFKAMSVETQKTLEAVLENSLSDLVWKSWDYLDGALYHGYRKFSLDLTQAEKDAVVKSLIFNNFGPGYISTDKDGNTIPDPDLREVHTVPDGTNVEAYFEEHILPDDELAWVSSVKYSKDDNE